MSFSSSRVYMYVIVCGICESISRRAGLSSAKTAEQLLCRSHRTSGFRRAEYINVLLSSSLSLSSHLYISGLPRCWLSNGAARERRSSSRRRIRRCGSQKAGMVLRLLKRWRRQRRRGRAGPLPRCQIRSEQQRVEVLMIHSSHQRVSAMESATALPVKSGGHCSSSHGRIAGDCTEFRTFPKSVDYVEPSL